MPSSPGAVHVTVMEESDCSSEARSATWAGATPSMRRAMFEIPDQFDASSAVLRAKDKLAEGGTALMELGEYPFSERYGWTQDRYGLSWQVMAMGGRPIRQKITPTLMFVGEQCGKAEEAIRLYASIFKNAGVGDFLRYGKGEEPDREGTIKHAGFRLEGQEFAAMDSAYPHAFSFSEAISFAVTCPDQAEIDYYWTKLTADGGQESMCGWLKDKFGVSWQVAPLVLNDMLRYPDPKKVERVTRAFLSMKKFDVAALERAFNS